MKFKVLIHGCSFVEESMLHEGIYSTDIPTLHAEKESIDTLVFTYEKISRVYFNTWFKKTSKNIKKCKLVEVNLDLKKY